MSSKNEQLFMLLSRTTTLLHRHLHEIFQKFHLTSTQFAVLEILYQKGPLCIKEIQEGILSTSGNVPLVVNNLVKSNYVTKSTDPADRRITRVALTSNGITIVEQVYPLQKQKLDTLLNTLSQNEKDVLMRQLLPLYKHIKDN